MLDRWGGLGALGMIETSLAIRNSYDGNGFRTALSSTPIDVARDGSRALRVLPTEYLEVDDDVRLDEELLVEELAAGKAIVLVQISPRLRL